MTGKTVAIILVAAVVFILSTEILREHRETMSPVPRAPALCFPEPVLPSSRELEGEFEVFDHVRQIPANVQPVFKEVNGSRWLMADPGKAFEESDYITDTSLPLRRLVFGGRSNEVIFLHYEQGGKGLEHIVAAFKTTSSTPEPLWRRYCPRNAKDLRDLRSMMIAEQCPTEAEWNKGVPCSK